MTIDRLKDYCLGSVLGAAALAVAGSGAYFMGRTVEVIRTSLLSRLSSTEAVPVQILTALGILSFSVILFRSILFFALPCSQVFTQGRRSINWNLNPLRIVPSGSVLGHLYFAGVFQ